MNSKYIYPFIGFLTILSTISGFEVKTQSLEDNPSLLTFTTLDGLKILDMDFNNNTITNNVNNKSYTFAKGDGKLVSSIKGNGFEFNGDYITIPKSDLDIKDTDTVMTVAFTYTYDGTDPDKIGYAISFGNYNFWIGDKEMAFNTGNSDGWGTSHNFIKGKTYHIIAEFNKNDVGKNKIYIDGVNQNLSQLLEKNYDNNNALFNNSFTIGTITVDTAHDIYPINEPSVIDEIKIYKKSLTETEVNNVANAHKIPELRGEVINNNYPKMSWATEILPENVLYKFGFEEDEQGGINLIYNSGYSIKTGGQEFTTEEKSTGKYSLKTPTTIPDKGNMVNAPYSNTSGTNALYYNSLRLGFDQGIPISATYRAKTASNRSSIRLYGDWDYDSDFGYYNSYTLEDYPAGTQYIKVSNPQIFPLAEKGYVHVTLDSDPFVHEQNLTGSIVDMENGIFKLSKPLKRDVPKGTQLRYRKMVSMFSFPTQTIVGDNKWNLYNANSYISNTVDIDWHLKPKMLRQAWVAYGDMYIDDIVVGHATKVRLYRDGSKVYEGYEAELNDTTATDKAVPTLVSNINSTMEVINATTSTRRINISFKNASDNGTSYDYQISAVSNEGVETPKSNVLTETVTSGVKGYSYVIDKSPTTVPDNTVDTTSTTISKDITDTGVYYFHIKTIDNAGNVSGVIHYKIDIPTLTAKANPSENIISLNWNMDDINYKTFKAYQKKPGSSSFQTISTTNFDASKQVKVLNVYPPTWKGTSIEIESTYTTWDGETISGLPKSASLKKWMEEPNEENAKGYGKGLIEVTPVDINDFNLNPDSYLKNSDGTYKYDVIMFGTYDSNGYIDLSEKASDTTKEFLESGRGVLFGHDTINQTTFKTLRDYVNIQFPGDSLISSSYYSNENIVSSDEVLRNKTGLLTNTPWKIEEERLYIPYAHTSHQYFFGDVWFKFDNTRPPVFDKYGNKEINVNGATNNAYLSTYNNGAVIQTGHSNGKATLDEQKILANTLFYLNQLSTDNFLDDNSAQDVNAPNIPQIYGHNFTSRGKVEVNFKEATDNGTTYEYYVQSEDKNGQVSLSNTVKETITSGTKGYSYVVDSSPNTIPDTDIEISKVESIKVNINDNTEKYVHIRAIDNVGNASETYHYKITESTNPTMTITGNPTSWVSTDVTLNVIADDLDSGIDYIILPNGNRVAGETASYVVKTNGSYEFKAVDKMGNETIQTVVVNKIDNESPQISYKKELSSDKTSMDLIISGYDSQSGFDYFIDPEGNKIYENSFTYKINNNGLYPFYIYDKVGRFTSIYIEVIELNANINPSEIDKIEYKLSGATIKDWTEYENPFYITNEGITTITARAYDEAGNLSNETTSIVKIDKTKPNNNSILIELKQ